MKAFSRVLSCVLLLAVAMPSLAHHSAAQYDFMKNVTVTGTVKRLRVANPHMDLTLEVGEGKARRDVAFEGHSANNLFRQGWRRGLVKEGDTLTIVIAPRNDGADGGYVKSVKTADGHTF